MNDKQLFNMYTIIFIVLASIFLYLSFRKYIKEMRTTDKLKIGLLILLFSPLIVFSICIMFVTIYGVADMFFGDRDILVTHLITNIPNFYALYMLIQTLKKRQE